MKFRGGEFSTRTTGNFQPELTVQLISSLLEVLPVAKAVFPSDSGGALKGFDLSEIPVLVRTQISLERVIKWQNY